MPGTIHNRHTRAVSPAQRNRRPAAARFPRPPRPPGTGNRHRRYKALSYPGLVGAANPRPYIGGMSARPIPVKAGNDTRLNAALAAAEGPRVTMRRLDAGDIHAALRQLDTALAFIPKGSRAGITAIVHSGVTVPNRYQGSAQRTVASVIATTVGWSFTGAWREQCPTASDGAFQTRLYDRVVVSPAQQYLALRTWRTKARIKVAAIDPSAGPVELDVLASVDHSARLTLARHPDITPTVAGMLIGDGNPETRAAVGANRSAPTFALTVLAADADPFVRSAVGGNPATPPDTLTQLAADANRDVRAAVAGNPSTPADTLVRLVEDQESWVREAAADNPACPRSAALPVLVARGLA